MSSSGGKGANRLVMDCPTLKSTRVNFYFVWIHSYVLFIFPSEKCILIESFSFYKYTMSYKISWIYFIPKTCN